jgi:hypothetical protein
MAKRSKKAIPRQPRSAAPATEAGFAGSIAQTISRNEIYHRLEWYFDRSHDPHGPHTIPPSTKVTNLLNNLSLADLYVNINKVSQTYIPAWNSMLFHGVTIPWVSKPNVAIGIKDVKTMGDLIDSLVLSYQHAGWKVIGA